MRAVLASVLIVATLAHASPADDLAAAFKQAVEPAVRVKRGACEDAGAKMQTCIQNTQGAAQKAMQSGGDGSADFIPRKVCTSLTDMVGCGSTWRKECGLPQDQFDKLMRQSLTPVLDVFSTIPGWDGNKCPAYRYIKLGEPLPGGAAINALSLLALLPLLALNL